MADQSFDVRCDGGIAAAAREASCTLMRYSPPLCRSLGRIVGEPFFKDALVLSVSSFSASGRKTGFTQLSCYYIYQYTASLSINMCMSCRDSRFVLTFCFILCLFATNDRTTRTYCTQTVLRSRCKDQIKISRDNHPRKTHSSARELRMPYILHQNVLARVAKKACPCHLLSY